jgi:hypothetical protein
MRRIRAISRLGGLAIGLGIGAALAASPGIASAAPDIDISFDGIDLFHTPGHTAEASSGMNDFAIAIGPGSVANATSGQFDTAFADGSNSTALASFGNFDSAFANDTNSFAAAGGASGNLSNGDFASSIGPNAITVAGTGGSIPAGNDVALVFDPFGSLGSHVFAVNGDSDLAWVVGDNSFAGVGFGGNFDLAEVFGNGLSTTAAEGANFLSAILSGPLF